MQNESKEQNMTKLFATVSLFCLVGVNAMAASEPVASDSVAKCFQRVAKAEKATAKKDSREIMFFTVAEKYGLISDENVVSEENKPAYFKLMQVYSENLAAPPGLFCKAIIDACKNNG
jgi:hypothetical protein